MQKKNKNHVYFASIPQRALLHFFFNQRFRKYRNFMVITSMVLGNCQEECVARHLVVFFLSKTQNANKINIKIIISNYGVLFCLRQDYKGSNGKKYYK